MELMQASRQWSSRPDDERYVSLYAMRDHFENQKRNSRQTVVSSRKLTVVPQKDDHKGLLIEGPNGNQYAPTNWAFGQLATLSEAPAGYLRTLPSPLAADCMNYGLKFKRDIEDVQVLLRRNGETVLAAANGPRYGRIWNADILRSLTEYVGDGVSGMWKVPGEFGQAVEVTKENTTLFAGDRDMFVFLADEQNRIEMPNRRNGQSGLLSRGFFMWNSEVGSQTFGIGTFLFDYVCCNRIVWGASQYKEIKIRHTASAPDRWIEQAQPALLAYSNSSAKSVVDGVKLAQEKRIDKVDEFLATRFGKGLVSTLQSTHEREEQRPIETLWDAATAVTAYARNIQHQDARVKLERQAGELLDLAA